MFLCGKIVFVLALIRIINSVKQVVDYRIIRDDIPKKLLNLQKNNDGNKVTQN